MEDIEKIRLKFTEGKASGEELRILEQWLASHPEEKKALFYEKDIIDTYAFVSDSKNYSPGQELVRFNSRLKNTKQKSIRITPFMQIAAAVVLAFLLGGVVHFLFSRASFEKQGEQAENRVISVPNGQLSQLFLADGTRIWINSGSTVWAPPVFNGDFRIVKLSGEAFFEVAKDATHPFRVEVEGQTIEVLGTSFNVRAYPDGRQVQTTLKEGSVKLHTPKGFMTLQPGQQAELDRATGDIKLAQVNPSNYDAWKEGRYEFRNENLVEVLKMVERWYDVELVYNEDEFKSMKFSGVIRRNKPVDHFLTMLGLSIPIRYEIIAQDKIKLNVR
ncbi:MAG: FecR family protein [Mangrovibacterium sp.]